MRMQNMLIVDKSYLEKRILFFKNLQLKMNNQKALQSEIEELEAILNMSKPAEPIITYAFDAGMMYSTGAATSLNKELIDTAHRLNATIEIIK